MKDWNISLKTLICWWLPLSIIWGIALSFYLKPGDAESIAITTFHYPSLYHWISLWLLGAIAIAASIVDWRSQILPDVFTLYMGIPAVLATTIAIACRQRSRMGWDQFDWATQWETFGWIILIVPLTPIVGAILGYIFVKGLRYLLQRKQKGVEQMGGGDVKIMLLLGALVGPFGLLPLVALACVFAWGISKMYKTKHIPFGPALTLAAFITLLTGLQWPI